MKMKEWLIGMVNVERDFSDNHKSSAAQLDTKTSLFMNKKGQIIISEIRNFSQIWTSYFGNPLNNKHIIETQAEILEIISDKESFLEGTVKIIM